jgi:tetratricopeptide (TPR) repeat protein
MMKRGGWLMLAALLIPVGRCPAQWIGDSAIEAHTHRGIEYVYNLSFDSARAEFQFLVHQKPDHPAGYFFLAMVDWWRIASDIENTSHDDHFLSELDRVIDLCDKRLGKNEHDTAALFFKGGALGFQGRLHGNREDWVQAANDGRMALPIVEDAYRLAPANDDVLLGMGVYHYYAAVIPDQYPIVKPLMVFFPKGDKEKGLRELRDAAANARYANFEATYFLLQILQNFEKRYGEALPLALTLHARFPNNAIFHKYVGRCYATVGNWDACARSFDEILRRAQQKRMGYDLPTEREARYYLGLHEMTIGNDSAALEHFYRTDELSRRVDKKPSGFMVMANLRIGFLYDLQKKRDLALQQYKKVLGMTDYQGAHEQAQRYLKSPYQKF